MDDIGKPVNTSWPARQAYIDGNGRLFIDDGIEPITVEPDALTLLIADAVARGVLPAATAAARVIRTHIDTVTPGHVRGCEACPLAIVDEDQSIPIAIRCAATPDGSSQPWPDYHFAPAPSWCPLRVGPVTVEGVP